MKDAIKRKKIWLFVVLVIGLILFAACGGGEAEEQDATVEPIKADVEPADTPEPAPTDTPEPAPTQAPEPTNTPIPEPVPAEEEMPAEPSVMDINIDRDPGHSIGFENSLAPFEAHFYLFLASPGDTIGAGVASDAELMIGIQDANTGDILAAAPSNENFIFLTIEENALYNIIIEDSGGQGGSYQAGFEASPKVSFALDPNYFIVGRLPEGGLLYYTFTAPGGVTLQGNAIPHPDTPIDLLIQIRDLETQDLVYESNESGLNENEQFSFTIPDSGDGQILTYIVSVEDVNRAKGAYILAVASDEAEVLVPLASPKDVVRTIFDAAASGDYSALGTLCDPLGENDGDTQMICDLAVDDANQEEFIQYFQNGQIMGDAIISTDGTSAQVSILIGPDGDAEETMELINRDGQWYLLGF
jgi:hypothetical protein